MPNEDTRMLKLAYQQMAYGIIILNQRNEIIFMNQMAEEIRGRSAQIIQGNNVLSCHPQKIKEVVARSLKALREEDPKNSNRMTIDKRNDKYYETNYIPIKNNNGSYLGSMLISKDITEQRKLEEKRLSHLKHFEEEADRLRAELQELFFSSLDSLIKTLEAKDKYTEGHSTRVADISRKIAQYSCDISPQIDTIELASQFHDIGKVGIPESILNKPGKLNEEEFSYIKEHPILGEDILAPILKPKSIKPKPMKKVIRHHHERYDGRGYPDGLKEDEIPIGARILAIADSYDAMTTDRPYRNALTPRTALKEINSNLGTQFDPELGEVFLMLHDKGVIN